MQFNVNRVQGTNKGTTQALLVVKHSRTSRIHRKTTAACTKNIHTHSLSLLRPAPTPFFCSTTTVITTIITTCKTCLPWMHTANRAAPVLCFQSLFCCTHATRWGGPCRRNPMGCCEPWVPARVCVCVYVGGEHECKWQCVIEHNR